jgi:diguanylate cyclase (GGDEF)-like protein
VGDQLLQLFAQRLLQLMRPTDAVARLGGDEFLVVVLGIKTLANAERVADKVLKAAAAPFHVGDLQLQVGASVGIALGGATETGGWDALMARADTCLYLAKKAGKGTYRGPREADGLPAAPGIPF